MRSLTVDELFAMPTAAPLSITDLARLREWRGSLAHPAECVSLIEQMARGRACPHCHCLTVRQAATVVHRTTSFRWTVPLPVLSPDVSLISDAAASYRRSCVDAGMMHEAVNVQSGNRPGVPSLFKTWTPGMAGSRTGARAFAVSQADTSPTIRAGSGCPMHVA